MTQSQNHGQSATPNTDSVALVIDLGTGGPKVGLCKLDGTLLYSHLYSTTTTRLADGTATQDPHEWWQLIKQGTAAALGAKVCRPEDIAAVAVTGMWASTVPTDASGNPVSECLTYMDGRGAKYVREAISGPAAGYRARKIYEYIRRTGGAPDLYGADPTGHKLFLKNDMPDVYSEATYFMEPVDQLSAMFTKRPTASAASMITSWACDIRQPNVAAYDPSALALAGLDDSKLPPLVPFGSVIAPVDSAVAAELGIPASAVVVTGSTDIHTAAFAAGAIEDFQTHMAISTTTWISCPLPFKKTDLLRQLTTAPGISPEGYVIVSSQETGGRSLQWVRDMLNSNRTPSETGELSFDDLTALAASSQPGSGGVIFSPWLQGERMPISDRNARAGFHGIGLQTSRADMVRAVMEGVALNARWMLDAADKLAGRRLDPIRIIGGGAQSDLWCSIIADVMDRTIEQVGDPMFAGIRGAALLAGVATGAVERSQVASLAKIDATYRPNPANRSLYDDLYAQLPGIYKAQKKLFKALAKVRKNSAGGLSHAGAVTQPEG